MTVASDGMARNSSINSETVIIGAFLPVGGHGMPSLPIGTLTDLRGLSTERGTNPSSGQLHIGA
jgi:hypothetical protein